MTTGAPAPAFPFGRARNEELAQAMDSLTQFALGAAVGTAVLGRRIGPRKAAIAGGLLGTLPDLDVLFPFDDPIESFTLHRGATHSFFVQAVVAPLFGEALVRLFKPLRDARWRSYLAVYLIFVTHSVIDALTVYGTRVFWPIFPDAVGTGSIFIIDPLYGLPLLLVTIWALCLRSWRTGFGRTLAAALVFSTAYLGWGLAAQQVMEDRAEALLARAGIHPERLLAIPTPFNTLFWKAIAIDGDRYINLYLPLRGGADAATAYVHPRGGEILACLGASEALARLERFSDGFIRLEEKGGEILVSDLRMGLTPNYVFSFAIAERTADGLRATAPERRRNGRNAAGDVDWLLANLSGEPALRQAEAATVADLGVAGLGGPVHVAQSDPPSASC